MELVAEKYKQKDIELIPSDWEVKMLDVLATKIGSGITPTGGESVYKSEGRPLVRSQNIGWGKLLLDDVAFIDEETHQTFPNTEINLNDVFLNISGASIGRSSYADESLVGGNVNQHVCIIRTVDSKLNPQYLNLFLLSANGQKLIDSFQSGGNRQGLNIGQIKNFPIPLPPIEEQTAIATALSDADALITSLEKLIAKKQNIKKGAMQQLLAPKENWVVKKLGELTKVFTKQTGFDYSAFIKPALIRTKTDSSIPFIQNKDFNDKWINFDTDYFIPKAIAIQFPKILLNEKSLLISISGSIGNIGIYDSKKLAFIGGAVAILKFKDTSLIDWILYYLKSEEGQNKLFGNVKSGSHQNLILDDIRKIEIPFPESNEQIAIAKTFSDIDAEIAALEKRLAKAQKIKQAMMQQLLTGKIRFV